MNTRNPLMFLVLLLGIVPASQAQFKSMFGKNKPGRSQFQPYSSVGFGIGTSHYYGDLAPYRNVLSSTVNTLRWNVTGNYIRHFTPRLSARIGLTIARLGADDIKFEGNRNYQTQFIRNLHFRNDVKELSVVGMYNFVPTDRNYSRRPKVQPYAFAGLVIFAHNPKAKTPDFGDGQEWIALQPIGTEGQGQPGYAQAYSLVQVGVPLGLGIRYKINQRWDVSAEAGLRVTFTKYLDDVGGNFADPNDLSPEAQILGNRTLEPTAARTGRDRTEGVRQFLIEQRGFPNDPTLDPFGQPIEGFYQKGDLRSSSSYPDSYLLTNFTLHYILPGNIKCPPLK
ncbi:MAG: outer membrane beta-barrel protein [Sphingobacteriaceae bacterium]|nr:outer membrane beta-barrel protein [Cytophagaceae bacterium]